MHFAIYREGTIKIENMEVLEKPIVIITNIVARSKIYKPFDLTLLKQSKPFDSSKFALSRIPITHAQTKFSIFQSGSVISRASKSVPEFEDAREHQL